MKKIVGLIVLILIGAGGFFGYRYYQDTYQGVTAYAKVPTQVPEKVEHQSESKVGDASSWYSYDYKLTFVKEDGSTKQDSYQASGDNPKPLEPGAYIKVKMSKKRILEGPAVVSESDIPENVLAKLK